MSRRCRRDPTPARDGSAGRRYAASISDGKWTRAGEYWRRLAVRTVERAARGKTWEVELLRWSSASEGREVVARFARASAARRYVRAVLSADPGAEVMLYRWPGRVWSSWPGRHRDLWRWAWR